MTNYRLDINNHFIKKNTKIILFSIILLGLLLRLFALSSKSLWGDELVTLKYAGESVRYIVSTRAIVEPDHPPLYHLLLHFVLKFDSSVFAVRLASGIFGVLTILITYMLSSRIFEERVALLSAFLLSISPLHIFYSQFVRQYTLLTFFSLTSLFLFYEALNKNDKKAWIGFTLINTLNIYTHHYAFFVIVGEAMFFLYLSRVSEEPKPLNRLLVSLGITAILYLPWLYVLVTYSLPSYSGFIGYKMPPPSVTHIPYMFYKFSVGLRRTVMIDWRIVVLLAFPVFLSAFFYGGYTAIQENSDDSYLLLTYFSAPVFFAFLFSYLVVPIFSFRYQLIILPVYLIFISNGILSLRNRKISILLLSSILILYAYILYDYYFLIETANWYLSVGL